MGVSHIILSNDLFSSPLAGEEGPIAELSAKLRFAWRWQRKLRFREKQWEGEGFAAAHDLR
jgi:hypothetical protein